MKRYLLFGFEDAYPAGGMLDFEADFDSVFEAADYLRKALDELGDNEWMMELWHLYDSERHKIVACDAIDISGRIHPCESRGGSKHNRITVDDETELVTNDMLKSWKR